MVQSTLMPRSRMVMFPESVRVEWWRLNIEHLVTGWSDVQWPRQSLVTGPKARTRSLSSFVPISVRIVYASVPDKGAP